MLHKKNHYTHDNDYETPTGVWDEIIPYLPKEKVYIII